MKCMICKQTNVEGSTNISSIFRISNLFGVYPMAKSNKVKTNKYPNPKKGEVYKLFYNPNNVNNCRIHIRGIVDGLIVCAIWVKTKQRYEYSVKCKEYFHARQNSLTLIEKKTTTQYNTNKVK